jgi:hypothetical protein
MAQNNGIVGGRSSCDLADKLLKILIFGADDRDEVSIFIACFLRNTWLKSALKACGKGDFSLRAEGQ